MNPIRVSVFSNLDRRPVWNRKLNISPSNSVFNQLHQENHIIGKRCCAYVKMWSTHNDTQNDELSYWPKVLQLILKMNKSSFGSLSHQNIVKQAVSIWWTLSLLVLSSLPWTWNSWTKNLEPFIFFSLSAATSPSVHQLKFENLLLDVSFMRHNTKERHCDSLNKYDNQRVRRQIRIDSRVGGE